MWASQTSRNSYSNFEWHNPKHHMLFQTPHDQVGVYGGQGQRSCVPRLISMLFPEARDVFFFLAKSIYFYFFSTIAQHSVWTCILQFHEWNCEKIRPGRTGCWSSPEKKIRPGRTGNNICFLKYAPANSKKAKRHPFNSLSKTQNSVCPYVYSVCYVYFWYF